jgi:cytosine/adenosine deaminase-related metal-dependent hydrolase
MAMLISGGLVVTFDPGALQGRIIPDGAVAVEGSTIAAVGTRTELAARYPKPSSVIDASGKVVMPGFIVTHTHMPYVLGHNMPVDFSQLRSFWDMLQKMGWEWLEDITTVEGIYAATRYAAMKMLLSGTTTVCEMVEGPNALPGALSASARAIDEVGIRAQVGFEVTERIPGVPIRERLDPGMAEKAFEENLAFMPGSRPGSACTPRSPTPSRRCGKRVGSRTSTAAESRSTLPRSRARSWWRSTENPRRWCWRSRACWGPTWSPRTASTSPTKIWKSSGATR